jgi:hypothetical protein
MKYTGCFLFFILLLSGIHSYSQSVIPDKPTLYYVTIDIETGNDIVVWNPSPSNFIEFYKVAVSITAGPLDPPAIIEIEPPVSVPNTIFINPNTYNSHFGSIGYTVMAVNDLGGGDLRRSLYDSPDSTIFLESVFDSCKATITLSWNDYNNWRGSIAAYNIRRRLGPGIYVTLTTLSEGQNTFVLSNIAVNQTYDLFVEVVNADGRRSTSNRIQVQTHMTNQPRYINNDYATISPGNFIDLSFTIDPASNLTHYNIMRSTSPGGPFVKIDSINTADKQFKYTDETPFTPNIYYYRLDAMNNCRQAATRSNLSNNIILKGVPSNKNISLSWNDYLFWSGGLDQYRIIRTRGGVNGTTDTLDIGQINSFNDDVSRLGNYEDPESSFVCYKILATENRNIHGIQGKSLSNRVCFSINPDIRMPDAFIPNDSEPMNQVFEPVFSFLPEHYQMIIYNRLGTKIWEGSNAWDGRVNGKYVPEGVYLYYLRIYNYSTNVIELNGKVTVLYR